MTYLINNNKFKALCWWYFSIVHDLNATANDLNNDLAKINDLGYQWKNNFNPDPFKQAQGVIFSRKIKSQIYLGLLFKNNPVNQTPLQKRLGMYLDPTLRTKWTNQLLYYGNSKLFSQDQHY